MSRITNLWCANLDTSLSELRTAAQAAIDKGAYLAVLLHAPLPTRPINVHGALPYGGAGMAVDWAQDLNATEDALRSLSDDFDTLMTELDCAGDVRPILCATADLRHAVELSARFSDLVTFAPSLRRSPDVMRALVHGCLFGAPVGALLNGTVDQPMRNVMVAWDDSLSAARAVHLALPFLRQAETVTIACFDPVPVADGHAYEPGAALAAWLTRQGCEVNLAQYPTGGRDVADCLTDRARDLAVDLIVMGAYGHSRLRQAVFGGTTRSMVEQTEQAVYLAH